jgi:hypothetical protein
MNRRNIIIIISVLGLALIGLIIYALIPKTQLLFSVAPHEVAASINGQVRQVTNGQKIHVKPGVYKITISRDQFDSYSLSVTVNEGKTAEVLVALNPQTDTARALLDNQESQDIIQRFTGHQMNNYQNTVNDSFPIIKILPIQTTYYYVYPCQSQKYPNDKNKLAVCVDITDSSYEPYVENFIKSKGYDLNNYEVIWNVQGSQSPKD